MGSEENEKKPCSLLTPEWLWLSNPFTIRDEMVELSKREEELRVDSGTDPGIEGRNQADERSNGQRSSIFICSNDRCGTNNSSIADLKIRVRMFNETIRLQVLQG